ncbi:hypothetical protein HDU76_004266 [Blyttiomyces sp. JEL0837]|nr:hypothetical protein HDU76_004266 [Blyttiomyces sp. JEL0837]
MRDPLKRTFDQLENGDGDGDNGNSDDGNGIAGDECALFADQLDPASKHKVLLIVGIDFGTSGTAYAYGFTRPGQNMDARNDVFMNRQWPLTNGGKTDTAVLFHKGECILFGHAATSKLANIKAKDRKNYLYLQRFKMQLYANERVNDSTMLEDEETGEKISALDAIAACLGQIKKTALAEVKGASPDLNESDILWVVTVPAIWREDAKSLMRSAAIKAGLAKPGQSSSLLLVLEPEAASIYCLSEDRVAFKKGDVYVVADCGGGTVDVTVHEVAGENHVGVKEAIPVSGGHMGGTKIDEAFYQLLEQLCGKDTITRFRKTNGAQWLMLKEEWERKKCSWDGEESSDVLVMLQGNLPFEAEKGIEAFNKSPEGIVLGEIEIDGSQLILSNAVMNQLSKDAIQKTVDHLSDILDRVDKAKKILLVGNFANSLALQSAFRSHFEARGIKVIVPKIPGDVVVRGAVILANRPKNIQVRRAAFSYGTSIAPEFIKGYHRESKRVKYYDGMYRCKDVADWLIKFGEEIPFGKVVSQTYYPIDKKQNYCIFNVYEGKRKGIEYVDDADCRVLGSIQSQPVKTAVIHRDGVEFSMLFGATEIIVSTKDPYGRRRQVKVQYE